MLKFRNVRRLEESKIESDEESLKIQRSKTRMFKKFSVGAFGTVKKFEKIPTTTNSHRGH